MGVAAAAKIAAGLRDRSRVRPSKIKAEEKVSNCANSLHTRPIQALPTPASENIIFVPSGVCNVSRRTWTAPQQTPSVSQIEDAFALNPFVSTGVAVGRKPSNDQPRQQAPERPVSLSCAPTTRHIRNTSPGPAFSPDSYVFMLSTRASDAARRTLSASALARGATAEDTAFSTSARYSNACRR